jgi:L-cysteine/cystine lyase
MNDLDRRSFLARSFGAGAVLPLGTLVDLADASAVGARATTWPQEDWVGAARAQLPATANSAYFQTGGVGLTPSSVLERVSERLSFQNEGPADPRFSGELASIEPELRDYLADQFGVSRGGVALTHSTSEGISIVAWSRNWQEGDEVVLSNQEHPANVVPWFVLRDRFGIVIREIDLDAGTHLIDEVRSVLSPRTRLVSLSHVSRNNGRRLRTDECAELAELLRAGDTLFHLDGAQGPGCVPTDFGALGCDAYSTCGHKWLFGPKGTGAFFVRPERLDDVRLSWAGSHSHATLDYAGDYTLLDSAARYEFGTRALADFAGFRAAVEWVEAVGWDRMLTRVQGLVGHAQSRIDETPGLSVASPRAEADRSGVFVVRLPSGCDATAVYNHLASDAHILTSPVRREGDLRLAIHFFNTEDEVDLAIDAVASACA